jgi:DNA-binding transcriptional ArsR family regulator
MEEKDIVRSLGALAHEARLKVFRALVVAGNRGITPTVMAEGAGMAATTLSFHLKELMHAGLVTQERDGRHLIYRASYERMNELLGYLTANCCQGEACVPVGEGKCR